MAARWSAARARCPAATGCARCPRTDGGYARCRYHCGSVWPHDTAIVARRPGPGRPRRARRGWSTGCSRAAEAFDYRLPELYAGDAASGRPCRTRRPAARRPGRRPPWCRCWWPTGSWAAGPVSAGDVLAQEVPHGGRGQHDRVADRPEHAVDHVGVVDPRRTGRRPRRTRSVRAGPAAGHPGRRWCPGWPSRS